MKSMIETFKIMILIVVGITTYFVVLLAPLTLGLYILSVTGDYMTFVFSTAFMYFFLIVFGVVKIKNTFN